jgi:predicted DNA-binding transcriptional regulator YafY
MALLFWGNVWTLVAWCELRVDFRSFRVDRFKSLSQLDETFIQERGQRYEDFLAKVRRELSDPEFGAEPARRTGPPRE